LLLLLLLLLLLKLLLMPRKMSVYVSVFWCELALTHSHGACGSRRLPTLPRVAARGLRSRRIVRRVRLGPNPFFGFKEQFPQGKIHRVS